MTKLSIHVAAAVLAISGQLAWAQATSNKVPMGKRATSQVVIYEDEPRAESLTSISDGALIFGSMSKQEILRAAKDSSAAEVWIKPGINGLQRILGVLADRRSGTLWVCSSAMGRSSPPTALKTFDLKSGASKASYYFPGGTGLCNDITVAADGTVYATDTSGGRVMRLKKGSTTLEEWASDPKLAGIDGIALGGDGTVYVNMRMRLLRQTYP